MLAVVVALLGVIGYFIKRILDKSDTIGVDVADMKPKVNVLWADRYAPAHSPRHLNETGKSILKQSGIKEIIDEKRNELLAIVKKKNVANAYDAEATVLEVVKELPTHCPDVVEKLKNGAFKTGSNVDVVLLVGGFYLRDLVFPDLGFSVTDLDKPKSS